MEKLIVYAPSYPSLSYILGCLDYSLIIVITPNEKIIEFCQKTAIECIPLKKPEGSTLSDLRKHKKYISQFSKQIRHKRIFFGFYSFDIWGLYLIKVLAKENRIEFHNLDFISKKSPLEFSQKYLQSLSDRLIYFILTGLKLKIYRINAQKLFLGVPPELLNQQYLNSDFIPDTEIIRKNRAFILNKIKLPDAKFIFVDQGSSQFNIPDELIEVLPLIFSKNDLLVKEHPNHPISNSKLKHHFNEIPRYIPLELILDHDTCMIGVGSTAMFEHKSVSLIHLVTWKNEESKNRFHHLIEKHKIPAPKNIEELKNLMATYSH